MDVPLQSIWSSLPPLGSLRCANTRPALVYISEHLRMTRFQAPANTPAFEHYSFCSGSSTSRKTRITSQLWVFICIEKGRISTLWTGSFTSIYLGLDHRGSTQQGSPAHRCSRAGWEMQSWACLCASSLKDTPGTTPQGAVQFLITWKSSGTLRYPISILSSLRFRRAIWAFMCFIWFRNILSLMSLWYILNSVNNQDWHTSREQTSTVSIK